MDIQAVLLHTVTVDSYRVVGLQCVAATGTRSSYYCVRATASSSVHVL
jgi:hypothetical protein